MHQAVDVHVRPGIDLQGVVVENGELKDRHLSQKKLLADGRDDPVLRTDVLRVGDDLIERSDGVQPRIGGAEHGLGVLADAVDDDRVVDRAAAELIVGPVGIVAGGGQRRGVGGRFVEDPSFPIILIVLHHRGDHLFGGRFGRVGGGEVLVVAGHDGRVLIGPGHDAAHDKQARGRQGENDQQRPTVFACPFIGGSWIHCLFREAIVATIW